MNQNDLIMIALILVALIVFALIKRFSKRIDPSGFTTIGSIKPLKGALEKRSIIMTMVKASSKDFRGNVEIPTENNLEYKKARDMSYICGLINYTQFINALNSVQNYYGLSNRQWLVSKPLIAMAKCIDCEHLKGDSSFTDKSVDNLSVHLSEGFTDDKRTNGQIIGISGGVGVENTKNTEKNTIESMIGGFLSRLFQIRDDVIDEHNWNRVFGICLLELVREKATGYTDKVFISNEDLLNRFEYKTQGLNINLTSKGMTKILSGMGFSRFQDQNSDHTKRGYKDVDYLTICDILIKQEFLTLDDVFNEAKKVSNLSVLSVSVDKMKKWYTDTFTDTK